MPNDYTEQQEKKQNGEAGDEMTVDDEIVPIVIRPGHIRFEPLGKGESLSLSAQDNHLNVFRFTLIDTIGLSCRFERSLVWRKSNFFLPFWLHLSIF